MSPSDLGERSIITGDPENCRRILKDCEEAGIQEVILYFNFGGLGHSDTIEAMDRAARELPPPLPLDELGQPELWRTTPRPPFALRCW